MTRLVFNLPSVTDPGYLRRAKQALEFKRSIGDGATPETIDKLVEFLLPYVGEPVDRQEAREALWDASQEQFMLLLASVTGGARPLSEPTTASS